MGNQNSFRWRGVLAAAMVLSLTPTGALASVRIGEVSPVDIETPHPYPQGGPGPELVWTHSLQHADATFIKLHFDEFELQGGDYLLIKDAAGNVNQRLQGSHPGGKWARAVPGDTAVLELYAEAGPKTYGLYVDKYGYGAVPVPGAPGGLAPSGPGGQQPQLAAVGGSTTTACGGEDREKICQANVAARIAIADAVGSLMYASDCGGMFSCTGFLFQQPDESQPRAGFFMTNAHCANSQTECDSMEVAFNYICDGDPTGPCSLGARLNPDIFECHTFWKMSCPLDFAVHELEPKGGFSPTEIYGALLLDPTVPSDEDALWIPQHPGFGGVGAPPSDLAACEANTTVGFGRTKEISEVGCAAGPAPIPREGTDFCSDPPLCPIPGVATGILSDLPHQCDTEAGASGSPVIDASTNTVVAIHHSGNCPPAGGGTFNQAVLMSLVIPAKDSPEIPALSGWSIGALCVLLVTAVAVTLHRRRSALTSA